MSRFIILLFLVFLSCTNNNVKINDRTFVFDDTLKETDVQFIGQYIDSVLYNSHLSKIDTDSIFLSKIDSTVKIYFRKRDTVIFYLKPYYQVFLNSLTFKLSNKNFFVEVSYKGSSLDRYYPEDSVIISSLINWEGPTYTELNIVNPINDDQSGKVADYMDLILGYITYNSDSSLSKLYLDRNTVILEIPYQKNIPIDKVGAKYFKHTANLISDSAFWGWDSEIRLMDASNNNVVKAFHNVDTLYVFMDK